MAFPGSLSFRGVISALFGVWPFKPAVGRPEFWGTPFLLLAYGSPGVLNSSLVPVALLEGELSTS